jgi:N-acetylmuramoyl-L-alanine amidase
MLVSLRSTLLFCAALSMTSVAPAQTAPSTDTLYPAPGAQGVTISVPELLDPQGEPKLSNPTPSDSDQAPVTSETPTVRPSGDLADMVAQLRSPDAGGGELQCLATGIYFESKGEPLAGQLAVGQVIANRADSGGRFPQSYCGVLFQRGQFSFIHGHSLPTVPRSNSQWQTAVAIAKIVDKGLKDSPVGNAMFFHARYVSPGWHLKRVAAIGNHIFFR